MKKLIQFGAGNIGRSFIGQLFARGGFDVVFIDIDDSIVDALNEKGRYKVVIKRNNQADEDIYIENVRAVNGKNINAVAEEIADADLLATSVGKGALGHIMPAIAGGLRKRLEKAEGTGELPYIDIIIAENIRNGAEYFYTKLEKELGEDFPLSAMVGFIETSIGKMVPIMRREDREEDPLQVFAEEYNNLILDKNNFKNPIPDVPGLKPVNNIHAYVDRKLFIHNLGHAASAYLGHRAHPDAKYIHDVLEDKTVLGKVRLCMEQSAQALNREYPEDLAMKALHNHIDDLLKRFQNRNLGDTVFRVGRDLRRKLGKQDRLLGAAILCEKHKCNYDHIAEAVRAALAFRATDETGNLHPSDAEFVAEYGNADIRKVLIEVSGLSPDEPLENSVIKNISDYA